MDTSIGDGERGDLRAISHCSNPIIIESSLTWHNTEVPTSQRKGGLAKEKTMSKTKAKKEPESGRIPTRTPVQSFGMWRGGGGGGGGGGWGGGGGGIFSPRGTTCCPRRKRSREKRNYTWGRKQYYEWKKTGATRDKQRDMTTNEGGQKITTFPAAGEGKGDTLSLADEAGGRCHAKFLKIRNQQ